MSLSRILNDEPSSSLLNPQSNSGVVSATSYDPTYPEMPSDPISVVTASSRFQHVYPEHQSDPHSIRGYPYHSPLYQPTPTWDPYPRQWVHGDMYAFNPPAKHYQESDRGRFASPHDVGEPLADPIHRDGEEDVTFRKRRRGVDVDSDYQPASTRRTPRRHPPRMKQPLHSSILVGGPELKLEQTEQDLRLTSSDLEDCREVWIGELGDYILETQKRQKQVGNWFEAHVRERNILTAQAMSTHYTAKLANIPPLPSTPPLLLHRLDDGYSSSVAGHVNGYDDDDDGFGSIDHLSRSFGPDADDAASSLGLRSRTRGALKRHAMGALSEASSDYDGSDKKDRSAASKKRRIDVAGASDIGDDLDRSFNADHLSVSKVLGKAKGKGALLSQREFSHDAVSLMPGGRRRKLGPRRKLDSFATERFDLRGSSHPGGSISGDVSPAFSRPTSPAAVISIVYELDEPIPSLKRAKKVDDTAMLKRVKLLEDTQRRVWVNVARKDIPKVYKYHAMGYQARQAQLERIARLTSTQARKPFTRTTKGTKDIQAKAKRLMREMLVFWKKNEREERDVRKRELKEAVDRAKVEEEKREAARQARKLEFLISQTELYSHFVGSKLKTAEVEGEADTQSEPAGADLEDVDPDSLADINFDDEDETNLRRHARYNAQEAVTLAKQRAMQFDTQAAYDRKTSESLQISRDQRLTGKKNEGAPIVESASLVDLDSDELNFQNPTSLSGQLTIKQPQMLMAQLKEYQLKGLNWLATLYEQGINGILADEMGLGKTVQSISLLAYLAETHDIWGPFLVVAPLTTLHNWQQELTRFLPRLKPLPYWGNVKDRATLRKFWSKKEISYNQDAPFHVLITSYHLIIQDQQYFQRVKWQYMILDEAQNIKNSSSVRWKTLLGFHCRNRLLLTGTPIQNSMQELWALLHFIMPSLFDSHDEFNEWFSKDIENAAENKGSKLSEHQLRRLHTILKPFMLRRVKRHVQNELSDKIEKDIYVDLSARQRKLYRALLANVSIADLLEKAANISDADSARSLMNLVMQFRKVCNHPELFERADVVAPFSFSRFGQSGILQRESDFVSLAYSTRNPIELSIPRILYEDGELLDIPSQNPPVFSGRGGLPSLFNIWSTDWLQRSLYEEESSTFGFLRLLDMPPGETHVCHTAPLIQRLLSAAREESTVMEEAPYFLDATFVANFATQSYRMLPSPSLSNLDVAYGLPSMHLIALSSWIQSCLSRPSLKWFVPPAVAPTIGMYCGNRTFLERQSHWLEGPLESLALFGLPPHLREYESFSNAYEAKLHGLSTAGLFGNSPSSQLPLSTMQVPDAKRLIYDSAKLARLDALLQELKMGDHRILIYFQMTRMMDLMEEYLIYRQYKYLRLDGSSKLEDRRDMVIDWQTRPDIFIFLLSTRAGGLGINLTAADTVIFYDHDWNPSNDAQAMDRAHRLGQTRQVTVYRLITKGTIDERIVQLARVKKDVQDIVVGNKNFTDVTKPSEIVQLLLNDDQLANLDSSTASGLSSKRAGKRSAERVEGEPVRDLWNEEGDDFFVHMSGGPNPIITENVGDENGSPVPGPSRGKKRRAPSGSRGRRSGAKGTGGVKRSFKSGTTTGHATPETF